MTNTSDLFQFDCGPHSGPHTRVILHAECIAIWNYSTDLMVNTTNRKLMLTHDAECAACRMYHRPQAHPLPDQEPTP